VRIDLDADELPRDLSRDRDILRIAQEALQNALRHASPTYVAISLRCADGTMVLEIADDGSGFDPAAPGVRATRLGLTSMEERASRLGGELTIESTVGRGTTVRLEVPIGG
jgi:signal transduction histidine kinase